MTEIPPSIQHIYAVNKVTKISHEKLPPVLEGSAFMFHHNFYPKPKIDLKATELAEDTWQKLLVLQQNYDDIVSKHSNDMKLTHLDEMTIDTDPHLPPPHCE